ncbi:MAG TPA: glycerophosphodiester phosphodiesterase [candidate division Zixibacteria bacterium]|jgi:glycerophosphoryl diester phosphodiesterase
MTNRPQIIAHRGSSYARRENTMSAFEQAIADGADGIEFDLRLSRDRRWVVHHDKDMAIEGTRRLIAELTANEIQQATRSDNDRVPLLTEFLEWARTRNVALLFDIKDTDGIAELTAEVGQFRFDCPVVFSSFRRPAIQEIASRRPEWRTALIVGDPKLGAARRLLLGPILRWALQNKLTALSMAERWVKPSIVAEIKGRGLDLAIWTVDLPDRIAMLSVLGVDAIITNCPSLGRKIVDGISTRTEVVTPE